MKYEHNGVTLDTESNHKIQISKTATTDVLLSVNSKGFSQQGGKIPSLLTVSVDGHVLPEIQKIRYIADVDSENSGVALYWEDEVRFYGGPDIAIDYVGSSYTIRGDNIHNTQIRIGGQVLGRIQHLELTMDSTSTFHDLVIKIKEY